MSTEEQSEHLGRVGRDESHWWRQSRSSYRGRRESKIREWCGGHRDSIKHCWEGKKEDAQEKDTGPKPTGSSESITPVYWWAWKLDPKGLGRHGDGDVAEGDGWYEAPHVCSHDHEHSSACKMVVHADTAPRVPSLPHQEECSPVFKRVETSQEPASWQGSCRRKLSHDTNSVQGAGLKTQSEGGGHTAALSSLQCWFQLARVKAFQEEMREGISWVSRREALAVATKWEKSQVVVILHWNGCTASRQNFLLGLFSPHCSQISLALFPGSSNWFLSAPYQELDFNQWFLHLLIFLVSSGAARQRASLHLPKIRPSLQRHISIMQNVKRQTFQKKSIKICPECLYVSTESHTYILLSDCQLGELGGSIFISGGQLKSPEGKHFSKGPMAFGAPNHFGAQDFL